MGVERRKLHGILPQQVARGKKKLTSWRVKVLTNDLSVWRILALARRMWINDPRNTGTISRRLPVEMQDALEF
jgi:hypothetical protein